VGVCSKGTGIFPWRTQRQAVWYEMPCFLAHSLRFMWIG
jgi:hypothetical protein